MPDNVWTPALEIFPLFLPRKLECHGLIYLFLADRRLRGPFILTLVETFEVKWDKMIPWTALYMPHGQHDPKVDPCH